MTSISLASFGRALRRIEHDVLEARKASLFEEKDDLPGPIFDDELAVENEKEETVAKNEVAFGSSQTIDRLSRMLLILLEDGQAARNSYQERISQMTAENAHLCTGLDAKEHERQVLEELVVELKKALQKLQPKKRQKGKKPTP
jgi:hypothetical protein